MTAQVLSTNNQQGSTAPTLSRNVPEPTSYTGKYYIKLPFKEEEYFAPTKTEAPDYALQFNGSNGYVEIKPSEKLAVTGDLTICAWVKIEDPNHGMLAIVGKHDGARPGPYALGLGSNGNPVFSLRGSDSVSLEAKSAIDAGRWQHIAATFANNKMTIYINGEPDISGEFGFGKLIDSTSPLRIGATSDSKLPLYFNGSIDQVQIWNKALSTYEIKKYMDTVISGLEDGLVGCWSMNEGKGQDVEDSSQNHIDGTIIGDIGWVFSNRALNNYLPVKVDDTKLPDTIKAALNNGQFDQAVFPEISIWTTTEENRSAIVEMLKKEGMESIQAHYKAGEKIQIFRSITGSLAYNFVKKSSKVESSMFLIETYRLSSFLGAYGVGRTVRTFSLLPGEKTTISISTYKKSDTTVQETSSIFDSYNKESADDFSNEMANEQSDTQKSDDSLNWNVNAKADASWGWGSAEISGGASGSSNSSRESFAKSVSNVTNRHAAKASAKRDVQINTSSEVKEQTGEETAIQRTIENINVSRTLNFIFRQMNQEYITLLHLVDVKVGFGTAGIPQSRRIVSLPELDSLIAEVVVNDPDKRKFVKDFIIGELENIRDYQDKPVKDYITSDGGFSGFVQKVVLNDSNEKEVASYYRLQKDFTSNYKDPATGSKIEVPGIIVNVDKIVMRTDDVLVDTLLGEGNALDTYSQGLQDQAVAAQRVQNEFLELKNELLRKIVSAPESKSVQGITGIYQQIFGEGSAEQPPSGPAPAGNGSKAVKKITG